jgi:hypothetical protein
MRKTESRISMLKIALFAGSALALPQGVLAQEAPPQDEAAARPTAQPATEPAAGPAPKSARKATRPMSPRSSSPAFASRFRPR